MARCLDRVHVSERQALRSAALSRTVVGKRVESVQSIHVRNEHVKRVATEEEEVRDLYKIPLELGFGGGQKWRAITHAVVQVADVEPNDKCDETNFGHQ